MIRGLRRYLNAALIGFIIAIVIYLFFELNSDEWVTGIVVGLVGAAIGLGGYVYLNGRFGGDDPELYDKDGNLVDRQGKAIRR